MYESADFDITTANGRRPPGAAAEVECGRWSVSGFARKLGLDEVEGMISVDEKRINSTVAH